MKKLFSFAVALLLSNVALAQVPVNPPTSGITQAAADARYCKLAGCTMAGDLLFTDATYDIGKTGATRPRDGFFSRYLESSTIYSSFLTQDGVSGAGYELYTTAAKAKARTVSGRRLLLALGGLYTPSDFLVGFGSTTGNTDGTDIFGQIDTGISRVSAGVVGIGTGAAASIAGGIQAATVALGGATIGANALAVTGTSLLSGATTMSAALTYGGVTLSNAVTGTGNMVLSAGPTLTGTITAAAADFSGNVSFAGTTTQKTGTFQYIAAGGSADVQTLTYSPAITAYATGQTFWFRAVGSNTTTTPTINVNGLGAKTMVKRASTALAANDLLINGHYIAVYNGTNMQIMNPAVP